MNINILLTAYLLSFGIAGFAQNAEPDKEIKEEKIIIKKRQDDQFKAFLGIATQKAGNGIKITDIVEGSAAEKSDLRRGDVITKLNGKEMIDPYQFSESIREMKPGDEIVLSVLKNGEKKEHKIKIILGQIPDQELYNYSSPDQNEQWDMPAPPPLPPPPHMPAPPIQDKRRKAPAPQEKFGFRDFDRDIQYYFNRPFDEWKEKQKPQLGIHVQDTEESKGVKVMYIVEGSAAAKAGIQEYDLITEIDGMKIEDTEGAKQALKSISVKPFYNIKLLRDGKLMVLEIKNPKKLKEANL